MRVNRFQRLPKDYRSTNQDYTVIEAGGTSKQALEVILNVIRYCKADPHIKELAHILYDASPEAFVENVANFAFKSCYFEPDASNWQRIKTARKSLEDRRANCVDYTVLMSSILLAGGLPVTVKLISTDGRGLNHIYPMYEGFALDVVPQQNQQGKEFVLRENFGRAVIGSEVEHKFAITKKLYP